MHPLHHTPAPVVHLPPHLLHHLVAPGEPGLGEAVAEADDGAVPHFHEVQLDTGLEGRESSGRLRVAWLHPPNPPPTVGHRAREPTTPRFWPLGWMEKTSTMG